MLRWCAMSPSLTVLPHKCTSPLNAALNHSLNGTTRRCTLAVHLKSPNLGFPFQSRIVCVISIGNKRLGGSSVRSRFVRHHICSSSVIATFHAEPDCVRACRLARGGLWAPYWGQPGSSQSRPRGHPSLFYTRWLGTPQEVHLATPQEVHLLLNSQNYKLSSRTVSTHKSS